MQYWGLVVSVTFLDLVRVTFKGRFLFGLDALATSEVDSGRMPDGSPFGPSSTPKLTPTTLSVEPQPSSPAHHVVADARILSALS
jgi:hypothetical protein